MIELQIQVKITKYTPKVEKREEKEKKAHPKNHASIFRPQTRPGILSIFASTPFLSKTTLI